MHHVRPMIASLSIYLASLSCSDSTQFSGGGGTPSGAEARGSTPTPEAPTPPLEEEKVEVIQRPPLVADTPTQDSPLTNRPPLSEEERARIQARCESQPLKTLVQSIRFPENRNCAWNQAGNLDRKDRFLQAIAVQSARIELPPAGQLCGIEIASAASTLHYDDFLVLTVNNAILLSSNQQIIAPLAEGQSFHWDFERIKGEAVDFESPAYCAGKGRCQVPITDIPGNFEFSLDPSGLTSVVKQLEGEQSFEIALIASGDNDDRDCYHTEFTLDFQLKYVGP